MRVALCGSKYKIILIHFTLERRCSALVHIKTCPTSLRAFKATTTAAATTTNDNNNNDNWNNLATHNNSSTQNLTDLDKFA